MGAWALSSRASCTEAALPGGLGDSLAQSSPTPSETHAMSTLLRPRNTSVASWRGSVLWLSHLGIALCCDSPQLIRLLGHSPATWVPPFHFLVLLPDTLSPRGSRDSLRPRLRVPHVTFSPRPLFPPLRWPLGCLSLFCSTCARVTCHSLKLSQEPANFLWSDYTLSVKLHGLRCHHSALPSWENIHRQHRSGHAGLCFNTTLFTETSDGLDVAHGLQFAAGHPWISFAGVNVFGFPGFTPRSTAAESHGIRSTRAWGGAAGLYTHTRGGDPNLHQESPSILGIPDVLLGVTGRRVAALTCPSLTAEDAEVVSCPHWPFLYSPWRHVRWARPILKSGYVVFVLEL